MSPYTYSLSLSPIASRYKGQNEDPNYDAMPHKLVRHKRLHKERQQRKDQNRWKVTTKSSLKYCRSSKWK